MMINELSLKMQPSSVSSELHSQYGRNSREFDVRPVQSLPTEIHSRVSSGGRRIVRPGSRPNGVAGNIGLGGLGNNYSRMVENTGSQISSNNQRSQQTPS